MCHYNLCQVLNNLISRKYIDLVTINRRKSLFDYGHHEVGNLSSEIKPEHLKRNRLKMTAREVMTFSHFFPLLYGDIIPEEDEVWTFMINFNKLIECLLLSNWNEPAIIQFRNLVVICNRDYVRLFQDTLKPKHHFLVHYPLVIKMSGPPKDYWCFRFEAKHKELKSVARSTNSRKNVILTIAKRYQLKFANYIITPSKDLLVININHEDVVRFTNNQKDPTFKYLSSQYRGFSQIDYKGAIYKKTDFVTITRNEAVLLFHIKQKL